MGRRGEMMGLRRLTSERKEGLSSSTRRTGWAGGHNRRGSRLTPGSHSCLPILPRRLLVRLDGTRPHTDWLRLGVLVDGRPTTGLHPFPREAASWRETRRQRVGELSRPLELRPAALFFAADP